MIPSKPTASERIAWLATIDMDKEKKDIPFAEKTTSDIVYNVVSAKVEDS